MAALKRYARWILVAMVPAIACGGPWPARADSADSLEAARHARAVTIIVVESYEATSRWSGTTPQQDLPLMRQPYGDLAERLFAIAGVDRVAADGEMVLHVRATGTAEATLYDSSINGHRIREATYRAARLAGSIRLETASGAVLRHFDAAIPAPYEFAITFGYDPYRDPNNAPFREAFEAPGGYAHALAALLRDLYGEAVLSTALENADPLVRRAAALALDAD